MTGTGRTGLRGPLPLSFGLLLSFGLGISATAASITNPSPAGDVADRRADAGRTDDGGHGDEDVFDIIEGDPGVGGHPDVERVGRGRCVHRDQRGDPGDHVLPPGQVAVLDRRDGHRGKRVTHGCVTVGHGTSPLKLGSPLHGGLVCGGSVRR